MTYPIPANHDHRDTQNKLGCDLLGLVGEYFECYEDRTHWRVQAIDWNADTGRWAIRAVSIRPPNAGPAPAVVHDWDSFHERVNGVRRYTPVDFNGR